jgi:hypothetical protein
MRLFAIATVRNESDIIGLNVRYHLWRGVDRFFIVDNGSTDGTTECLSRLARDRRVSWTRDDGPWHQAEAQTELARTAARAGADWVVSIDADEFWTPAGRGDSLQRALADCRGEAVRVPVVNFVQDRRAGDLRPGLVLSMVYRVASPVGPPEACEQLVEAGEIAYVEMEYSPKVIARASEAMGFITGAHGVAGLTPIEVVATDRIVCLHAPLRARSILESKAEQGQRCEAAGRLPGEAWHVRRWYRLADQPGALDAEWAANSQRDGTLQVGGREHRLVRDTRLRDAVRRFSVRGRFSSWRARVRVVRGPGSGVEPSERPPGAGGRPG